MFQVIKWKIWVIVTGIIIDPSLLPTCVGETGDNCNTGHVVTGDPTPRENDLRWLF